MPLRCALLILWAACSSGARDGDGKRCSPAAAADQDRVTELHAAGYDPKVAARMMWWSTTATYLKFKLEDHKIGRNHLYGKVRLASNSEAAVLRDGSNAYVIFRGSVMCLLSCSPHAHRARTHLHPLLILTPQSYYIRRHRLTT
jgi:hypothetical protein